MNIFYASPDTPHQGCLAQSRIWRSNLYDSLRDMGHDLTEFQYDYTLANYHLNPNVPSHHRFIEENRPRFSEELVRQVDAAHRRRPVDVFFSYFYSAYVDPEAIREIGRRGIVTLNWFCNASYQLHLVAEIAPAYHFCLVPERFRLDDYRRLGANPIYCQEAANPNRYRPWDIPHEYDVTFVGQCYGTRPELLGRMYQAGLDVRAWGPCWHEWNRPLRRLRAWTKRVECLIKGRPFVHPAGLPPNRCGAPLSDDELIRMYSASRVSLGFTAVAELPKDGSPVIRQVRLRDFEATMSGAFYMVEQFDELTEFFEPDREIVFFRTAEELVDKAEYYLRHPAERERIRQASLRRARAEHTWQRRFETVFRTIGLPRRGDNTRAA